MEQVLKVAHRLFDKSRFIRMDLDQVKKIDDIFYQVETEIELISFDCDVLFISELEDEGK